MKRRSSTLNKKLRKVAYLKIFHPEVQTSSIYCYLGSTLSGNVGLVMSQSLILSGMLQYGAKQTAEVSNQMTSVERIVQYTELDKEGPFESVPTKRPHRDWPQRGRVVFEKLSLRYVPDESPVLKGLDIVIEAGEKVSCMHFLWKVF